MFCQTALVAGLVTFASQPASAQYTTLRNPLIPGADYTNAGCAPATMPPPPPGDGTVPPAVTPGMSGNPGYEPFVPYVPANSLNVDDSQVSLPDPSTTSAPGQLGATITVPPPPSALGDDPGILAPNNSGYNPPALQITVQSGGGLGADQAPTSKWGGQTTQDFGRNIKSSTASDVTDFGQLLQSMSNLATTPQYSQDGVRTVTAATGPNSYSRQPQLPGAQQTMDYGMRQTVTNAPYANNGTPVQTQYYPTARPVNPGPGSTGGSQDGSGNSDQYGDPYMPTGSDSM